MGSAGESHDKGIDETVGTLVWVRRRNGSWWPGQIIDSEECPVDLMGSPRVGTPIKLLGREDAPVDWYNLENSKKVKPFRSGEFDDSIEKAILAASNPARKVVNYVRRDDAIIHALEIEREKSNADVVKPAPTVSLTSKDSEHIDDEFAGFDGKNTSLQGLNHDSKKARARITPNDSDDDESEGVKRMRGLHDLGNGPIPEMKRKRLPVEHVQEFSKKKIRSRPLINVLESAPLVSAPVMFERLPPPVVYESKLLNQSLSVVINNSENVGVSNGNRKMGNAFGLASGSSLAGSKIRENVISSLSAFPEKDPSGMLSDVPLVLKRQQPAGICPYTLYQKPQVGAFGGRSSESSQVETLSLGNETVSTSSGATDIDSVPLFYDIGNSKWPSKGKREIRYPSKGKREIRYPSKFKKPDPRKTVSVEHDFNEHNLDEYWGRKKSLPGCSSENNPRQLPYRQSRSVMNPKYGPEFSMSNQEDLDELYDVFLEVNVKTRPQRVAFTSVRSNLTNLPVVGHPLPVEILEDNYTDGLVRYGISKNNSVPEYEGAQQTGGGKHLKSHCISSNTMTKLRKSVPSSKKIRKLSSIIGLNRLNEGEARIFVEGIVNYAIACIPIKVVYSRMNAALKGQMRPPKRAVKLGKH